MRQMSESGNYPEPEIDSDDELAESSFEQELEKFSQNMNYSHRMKR